MQLNQPTYYRLIALWALCEGVLGGIIHGFNLPISGLIVGSAAVIIICLIGFYTESKSAIIRATILVCIFKLMLSPQSPLPAYVAVLFQGLTGSLFFWNKKFFKVSCILFAAIALLESGVQRILVMTVLFGMPIWKAINDFINGLTHQKEVTNYSMYIAGGYVMLHVFVGIFVGWYAGKIPKRIEGLSVRHKKYFLSFSQEELNTPAQNYSAKKKKRRLGLLVFWLLLLVLFLQSQFHIGKPLLSSNSILQIIVRSLLILLAWYFIVSPILMLLLKRWLEKQKQKSESDIKIILELLPSTRLLLERSWQLSSSHKGLKRLNEFSKIVLVNSLHNPND